MSSGNSKGQHDAPKRQNGVLSSSSKRSSTRKGGTGAKHLSDRPIFHVWSTRHVELSNGAEGKTNLYADHIKAHAEVEIAKSTILALCAAFGLKEADFHRWLTIDCPTTAVGIPEAGRIGVGVGLKEPLANFEEIREFYRTELQEKSLQIVRAASTNTAPPSQTTELDRAMAEQPGTNHSSSATASTHTTPAAAPAEDRAEVARRTMAQEISSRFIGKHVAFQLATDNAPTQKCHASIAVPQRTGAKPSAQITLFGHINMISKKPAQLKILAAASIGAEERSLTVTFMFQDALAAELAAHFSQPSHVRLEFVLKEFSESVGLGSSTRHELVSCRPTTQSRAAAAANEITDRAA